MTYENILFRRRDDESLWKERSETDRRLRVEREGRERALLDSRSSPKEREAVRRWLAAEHRALDKALGVERERVDEILLHERKLSRTDLLTELPNSRLFMESLSVEAHRCRLGGLPLSLVYMDIDNFKIVNDRFGHQAGDRLLQKVSKILSALVRHEDVAARLGGDEFALLLCGLSQDEVERIANRVLERVRALSTDYAGISLSVSAGMVCFQGPPPSVAEILNRADQAMYQAKAAGKDTCLKKVLPHLPLRRPSAPLRIGPSGMRPKRRAHPTSSG